MRLRFGSNGRWELLDAPTGVVLTKVSIWHEMILSHTGGTHYVAGPQHTDATVRHSDGRTEVVRDITVEGHGFQTVVKP